VLSFSVDEFNPANSWVFSDAPDGLHWLSLQGGLRYPAYRTDQPLALPKHYGLTLSSNHMMRNVDFHDERPGRGDLHPIPG